MARAKEQIENRRKIQVEEVKQKRLSIRQDEERLEEAYSTLDKLFVIAPSPGIAIISRNWSTDNKFQLGDQCWSSQQLIQLPDLSTLKAKVSINEVDISQVTKGLKVQIRPDAFSDSTFTGYVATVANLAQNKDNRSNIKVFPVEIVINEYNKNLLPGLTVSCRIIVDEIPDVIFISIHCNSSANKSASGSSAHILSRKDTRNPNRDLFDENVELTKLENSVIAFEDDQSSYKDDSAEDQILNTLLFHANFEHSVIFAQLVVEKLATKPFHKWGKGIHQNDFLLLKKTLCTNSS